VTRILLVDDDATQLDIRKQILERAGYEVISAQTATEAVERWSTSAIVLMDLRIPRREDGLRLIQAIAGRARIIVLSGAEADPALPVDEFLTKPCPSKRLLAAIEKWESSAEQCPPPE